jgi:hypothetical protein
MNSSLKQILIPTVSAVAGGLIVFAAMRVIPAKSAEIGRPNANQKNEAIYDDMRYFGKLWMGDRRNIAA